MKGPGLGRRLFRTHSALQRCLGQAAAFLISGTPPAHHVQCEPPEQDSGVRVGVESSAYLRAALVTCPAGGQRFRSSLVPTVSDCLCKPRLPESPAGWSKASRLSQCLCFFLQVSRFSQNWFQKSTNNYFLNQTYIDIYISVRTHTYAETIVRSTTKQVRNRLRKVFQRSTFFRPPTNQIHRDKLMEYRYRYHITTTYKSSFQDASKLFEIRAPKEIYRKEEYLIRTEAKSDGHQLLKFLFCPYLNIYSSKTGPLRQNPKYIRHFTVSFKYYVMMDITVLGVIMGLSQEAQ